MVDNAQMIITDWGDNMACSVASPQLPGIVAAYDRHPDPLELFNLAVSSGLAPDGDIDVHIQTALEVDEKQFFVRSRHDHRGQERGSLAATICHELTEDPGLREYADADRYDEALIVAALSTDLIRSVMVGAEPDQPLTIGTAIDQAVHYIGLVSVHSGGRSLSDLGLDGSSTVGSLFDLLSEDSEHHHQHGKVLVTASAC